MLYTQCARCFSIGPLMCGGQLFPHPPLAMVSTPRGLGCPGCGAVMNIFTCGRCGTTQYLLQPGVAPAAAGGGSGFGMGGFGGGSGVYAPVVQAGHGASSGTVRSLFEELGKAAAREAGTAAVDFAFGRFNG